MNRYDPKRSFATWLLSIAAHYCIDQQRKRRIPILSVDLLPEEDAPDPAPNPEKVVSELEESSQMRRLLNSLGPQDRAAVILRYWYEFSEEEIARIPLPDRQRRQEQAPPRAQRTGPELARNTGHERTSREEEA